MSLPTVYLTTLNELERIGEPAFRFQLPTVFAFRLSTLCFGKRFSICFIWYYIKRGLLEVDQVIVFLSFRKTCFLSIHYR